MFTEKEGVGKHFDISTYATGETPVHTYLTS